MTKKKASIKQTFQAFLKLTKGQRSRLERVARFYCGGSCFSGSNDLLHEVLLKTLGGDRRWTLDVRFTSFMCNAIRSVADANRQRHETHALSLVAQPNCDSDHEGYVAFEEIYPSEEDRMIAREEIKLAGKIIAHARSLLADDLVANLVLDGVVAERSRKDICKSAHLSLATYIAARERLKRAISKARARYEQVHERSRPIAVQVHARYRTCKR